MATFSWVKNFAKGVRELFQLARPASVGMFFSEIDCAELHTLTLPDTGRVLDDQTWRDLLIDRYFDHISQNASIFGKQALYRRLRTGTEPELRNQSAAQIRSLMENSELRHRLDAAFTGLQTVDTEIANLLFVNEQVPKVPRWLSFAKFAPILLLVAALNAAFSPVHQVALGALALAIALLTFIFGLQLFYDQAIRRWNMQLRSVNALLATTIKLGKLGKLDHDDLDWFKAQRHAAARLARKLNRVPLPNGLIEAGRDYLDWFFLGKVRQYFKQAYRVAQARTELREMYLRCADLEANVAIVHHLLQMPSFCWAKQTSGQEISLTDMVHPLLEKPEPLSLNMHHKSIFLSGKNGGGKSTLLRTLGINAVAARTFGLCYASQAVFPEISIRASMINQDSLLDGESLYISELRRARELLEHEASSSSLFLIDEIFRGTNYLESVSAAAALLHRLADRGMVVISSHNLVLGPILSDKYTAVHLETDAATQKYTLKPGVLEKTNGISLLKSHGFDEHLERDAVRVFEWLSQYLSQPDGDVRILADRTTAESKTIQLRAHQA